MFLNDNFRLDLQERKEAGVVTHIFIFSGGSATAKVQNWEQRIPEDGPPGDGDDTGILH